MTRIPSRIPSRGFGPAAYVAAANDRLNAVIGAALAKGEAYAEWCAAQNAMADAGKAQKRAKRKLEKAARELVAAIRALAASE